MAEIRAGLLERVAELAERVGYVFIATADGDGNPHLAAARTLKLKENGRIAVNEWFCPGTMSNLRVNPRLAIVIWEPVTDTGYQLRGEMESMLDIDMLDGYAPEAESKAPLPQVETQLLVRVSRITDFRCAPHTDVEER